MTNALVSRLDRLGVDTIVVADGDPARAPQAAYFAPLPERTELYVDTFPNPLLSRRRPAWFVASIWRYAGAALRLMVFLRRRRPLQWPR